MAGPSQAVMLVALANDVDLFREAGEEAVYGTVKIDNHVETWPIRGVGFRNILRSRFFEATGGVPGSQAMQDAIDTLGAKAAKEGIRAPVALRIAGDDETIYLDLCDDDWRAVKITPTGWETITAPPLRFRRPRGMQPLPEPQPGGTLDDLRRFVHLPDDAQWSLFVVWLLQALRPGVPYGVLAAYGEQGSAKSTLGRVARALIDPGRAGLRSAPKEPRDLAVAANNSWICGFDNISTIPDWLSDGFCGLATGAGFGTRQLYADLDEILFEARRPVLLNSIEDVVLRGDLLDRTIRVTLPYIKKTARREERIFWREFEAQRPQLLGALLTALSQTMAEFPTVVLTELPRMADLARWGVAAERALGWPSRRFLDAYQQNVDSGHEENIEGRLVGPVLVRLMAERETWEGTASELLVKLSALEPEHVKRKEWPTSARKLSGDLRRLAPSLRELRINITMPNDKSREGHDRRRVIRLEKEGKISAASAATTESSTQVINDPDVSDVADVANATGRRQAAPGGRPAAAAQVAAGVPAVRPVSNPQRAAPKSAKDKGRTGVADAADVFPLPSNEDQEAGRWR